MLQYRLQQINSCTVTKTSVLLLGAYIASCDSKYRHRRRASKKSNRKQTYALSDDQSPVYDKEVDADCWDKSEVSICSSTGS